MQRPSRNKRANPRPRHIKHASSPSPSPVPPATPSASPAPRNGRPLKFRPSPIRPPPLPGSFVPPPKTLAIWRNQRKKKASAKTSVEIGQNPTQEHVEFVGWNRSFSLKDKTRNETADFSENHNDFDILIQPPPPPPPPTSTPRSTNDAAVSASNRNLNAPEKDIRFYYKFHEAEAASGNDSDDVGGDATEMGGGGNDGVDTKTKVVKKDKGDGSEVKRGQEKNEDSNLCPLCSKRLCDLVTPGEECGGDHAIGTGACCMRGVCLEDVAAKRKKERGVARQRARNPKEGCNCRECKPHRTPFMVALEEAKRRVTLEPDGAYEAPTNAERTWLWTRRPTNPSSTTPSGGDVIADDVVVQRGRCGRPEVIPPDLVVGKAPDYMASPYPGERWSQFFFKWYAQENDPWGEDYKRCPDVEADFQPKLPATLILDVDKKPVGQGEDEEEIIEQDLVTHGVTQAKMIVDDNPRSLEAEILRRGWICDCCSGKWRENRKNRELRKLILDAKKRREQKIIEGKEKKEEAAKHSSTSQSLRGEVAAPEERFGSDDGQSPRDGVLQPGVAESSTERRNGDVNSSNAGRVDGKLGSSRRKLASGRNANRGRNDETSPLEKIDEAEDDESIDDVDEENSDSNYNEQSRFAESEERDEKDNDEQGKDSDVDDDSDSDVVDEDDSDDISDDDDENNNNGSNNDNINNNNINNNNDNNNNKNNSNNNSSNGKSNPKDHNDVVADESQCAVAVEAASRLSKIETLASLISADEMLRLDFVWDSICVSRRKITQDLTADIRDGKIAGIPPMETCQIDRFISSALDLIGDFVMNAGDRDYLLVVEKDVADFYGLRLRSELEPFHDRLLDACKATIFEFSADHKTAFGKLLMVFLAYCRREVKYQSEKIPRASAYPPAPPCKVKEWGDDQMFDAMDKLRIKEVWRRLRNDHGLIQKILRAWFIAAPALRQKVILPRKIKSSSFVEILESAEFVDRFRYLFPLLNVVVEKLDSSTPESLVDAVINFDVEIRSCFVNFRHEELRVFTDAIVNCVRQKMIALTKQKIAGDGGAGEKSSKEKSRRMRDSDAEKLADDLDAFGNFLDFLEEATDDRLREMEAKRWKWARLVARRKPEEEEEEEKKKKKNHGWDEEEESRKKREHERKNVEKRERERRRGEERHNLPRRSSFNNGTNIPRKAWEVSRGVEDAGYDNVNRSNYHTLERVDDRRCDDGATNNANVDSANENHTIYANYANVFEMPSTKHCGADDCPSNKEKQRQQLGVSAQRISAGPPSGETETFRGFAGSRLCFDLDVSKSSHGGDQLRVANVVVQDADRVVGSGIRERLGEDLHSWTVIQNPSLLLCATRDRGGAGKETGVGVGPGGAWSGVDGLAGTTGSSDARNDAGGAPRVGGGERPGGGAAAAVSGDRVGGGRDWKGEDFETDARRQSNATDESGLRQTAKEIVDAAVVRAVVRVEREFETRNNAPLPLPTKPSGSGPLKNSGGATASRIATSVQPAKTIDGDDGADSAVRTPLASNPSSGGVLKNVGGAPSSLSISVRPVETIADAGAAAAAVPTPLVPKTSGSGVMKNSGGLPSSASQPTKTDADNDVAAKAEKIKGIFDEALQRVAVELAGIAAGCSCRGGRGGGGGEVEEATVKVAESTSASKGKTSNIAADGSLNAMTNRESRKVSFGAKVWGKSWAEEDEEGEEEEERRNAGARSFAVRSNRTRNASGEGWAKKREASGSSESGRDERHVRQRAKQNWNENAEGVGMAGNDSKRKTPNRSKGNRRYSQERKEEKRKGRSSRRTKETPSTEHNEIFDEDGKAEEKREVEREEDGMGDEFFATLFDIYLKKMKKAEREKSLERGKNAECGTERHQMRDRSSTGVNGDRNDSRFKGKSNEGKSDGRNCRGASRGEERDDNKNNNCIDCGCPATFRGSCQCAPVSPPASRPCFCVEEDCGCPPGNADWTPRDGFASPSGDAAAATTECYCDDDCDCENSKRASSDCQCGPHCDCDGEEEETGRDEGGDLSSKIMMMELVNAFYSNMLAVQSGQVDPRKNYDLEEYFQNENKLFLG